MLGIVGFAAVMVVLGELAARPWILKFPLFFITVCSGNLFVITAVIDGFLLFAAHKSQNARSQPQQKAAKTGPSKNYLVNKTIDICSPHILSHMPKTV
jgi:hypothetical protein